MNIWVGTSHATTLHLFTLLEAWNLAALLHPCQGRPRVTDLWLPSWLRLTCLHYFTQDGRSPVRGRFWTTQRRSNKLLASVKPCWLLRSIMDPESAHLIGEDGTLTTTGPLIRSISASEIPNEKAEMTSMGNSSASYFAIEMCATG